MKLTFCFCWLPCLFCWLSIIFWASATQTYISRRCWMALVANSIPCHFLVIHQASTRFIMIIFCVNRYFCLFVYPVTYHSFIVVCFIVPQFFIHLLFISAQLNLIGFIVLKTHSFIWWSMILIYFYCDYFSIFSHFSTELFFLLLLFIYSVTQKFRGFWMVSNTCLITVFNFISCFMGYFTWCKFTFPIWIGWVIALLCTLVLLVYSIRELFLNAAVLMNWSLLFEPWLQAYTDVVFITESVGFSAHRFYIAASAPSLARLISMATSDINSSDIGTRTSSDCSMVHPLLKSQKRNQKNKLNIDQILAIDSYMTKFLPSKIQTDEANEKQNIDIGRKIRPANEMIIDSLMLNDIRVLLCLSSRTKRKCFKNELKVRSS